MSTHLRATSDALQPEKRQRRYVHHADQIDLGVPLASFMDLQNAAMRRLRLMTQSAVNTGTLLDEVHTSKASGLPSLIRYLGQIGLDYHFDPFLYAAVELAVIAELRDIKHRGRIPVPKGVTLYGLPDETGILKEGEIFVITERAPEGGKKVEIRNNVIITRSPALHPGDIQVANAVDVPPNSPLRNLSNVVVFSKWGQRDLPSKLAGGDLDGDTYNVSEVGSPSGTSRRTRLLWSSVL